MQAVLARQLEHLAELDADARAAVDALLCSDPAQRCGAEALRRLAFFEGVPWDGLWDAQPPPVLPPPPPADADADADDDSWEELRCEAPAFAVDALRAALQVPPWALQEGEREVRSAPAARKRGLSRDPGRLSLTSRGRLVLLPERGDAPLLLLLACVRSGCVRALDDRHLALSCDAPHGDVFVELLGSPPPGAAAEWAAAVASVAAALAVRDCGQ
jgi:hypothetical protein